MQTKNFRKDLIKIFNLLKAKEKFSFSKYADGELAILQGRKITNCDGWTFDPQKDKKYQKALLDSFRFSKPGYYVGIVCPCCVPKEHVQWMKENVEVPESQLTWANLFVNSNYSFFKENFIPEFKNHNIVLVANKNAKIDNLPFKVETHIAVGNTAWKENFDLVRVLPSTIGTDKLVLFCAGPLGNMLAAEMWKHNKNNTYIDIGSTLNPWLTENNRGYLKGASTLNKTCIWE